MACFNKIPAWHGGLLPSGKQAIIFKRPDSWPSTRSPLMINCGNCIGCRLERSRQWAMRCMDEARVHKQNCFLTLTYDDVCVPESGGLSTAKEPGRNGQIESDIQLFMKRLRRKCGSLRFFQCGEYGEMNGRPHHHALIFGFDFPDRVFKFKSASGCDVFTSKLLDELWGNGLCSVGDVTFDSAAYVARYVMKKVNGELADEHYVDKSSGYVLPSEYVTMSRRPGLGKAFYDRFKTDMFPSDNRIVNGVKVLPAKYYSFLFEVENPVVFSQVKDNRRRTALRFADDNTDDRLRVKEECKRLQIKKLKRGV